MRDKIIKTLISILLIQLPFLDMIRTTNFRHFEFWGISLIELINIVLIGVALVLTLTKIKKKEIFKLAGFLALVGIYLFLHYQNIIKFDTSIFAKADFNFITETFYICRVYLLPLMLLYVLLGNRDIFNKNYYIKMFKIIIGIISFSIIILNILKLSYISYSPSYQFIERNIFDYFLYEGNFRMLSSRGWFDSANEISAIMFLLLPINIYLLYKQRSKSNIILYVGQCIAMILLGTRTSAYGIALISGAAIIIYLITCFFQKEKISKWFMKTFSISFICCFIFLLVSPFMINQLNEGKPNFSIKNKSAYSELNKNGADLDLEVLFIKYQEEYLIKPDFIKLYPVNNDKEFWFNMAKRDKALNNDSRRMKMDIINRIYEKNNNPNDKYLGMGYTLNFMDIERDYVYQFYMLGICGLILFIGPYFLVLIREIIKGLFNFKRCFNLKTILCFMGPILGLFIAYYSGHVFGWVSPMMYLVMSLGFLSLIVEKDDLKKKDDYVVNPKYLLKSDKPFISVIVPVYNTKEYLETCLDSIVNQSLKNIEIIVINDGSTDDSQNIIDEYTKECPEIIKCFKKENSGLSDTRNFGIKKAGGDYIALVDSDDYIDKDMLLKMYDKAVSEDLELVVCDTINVFENGSETYIKSNLNYSDDSCKNYLLAPSTGCIKLYHHSLFNNFGFKSGILYEDLEFTPSLILKTNKVGFINEGLYYYLQRKGSIMKQKEFNERFLDIFSVLDINYNNLYEKYPTEVEYMYISHLLRTTTLRFLDYKNSFEYLNRIVKTMKDKFPNWQDNIYLKKSSKKFQLICKLAYSKKYKTLKIIKILTGR